MTGGTGGGRDRAAGRGRPDEAWYTRPVTRVRTTAAVLMASAALAAAGCSGGGDDGPDLTAGLTAQEILDRGVERGRALTSFRVSFEGEVSVVPAEGAADALPIPANALAGVPFTGEGPVVQPSRFSFDLSADLQGLPLQANLTRVDDRLYLGLLGRDYALEIPPARLAVLDSTQAFPAVAGWVSEPRTSGVEEVDGEPAMRIDGTIDATAIGDDLVGIVDGVPGLAEGTVTPAEIRRRARRLQAQLRGSTVSIWVRTEDLTPVRAQFAIGVEDGGVIAPELRSFTLSATVTLSDIDGDLTVEAPPGAQPLSLDELTGVLG